MPILALPGRVPDQPDSAAKAARLGFCLPVIMGRNFSAATVRGALERLLTEPEFREAAARVSRRLRARRRTPTEEAGGAGPLRRGGPCTRRLAPSFAAAAAADALAGGSFMVAASRRGHVCTCKRARPCVLGQVALRVTCLCARHMANSSRVQRMRPACEQAGPPCRRWKLLRGKPGRGPSADARARAAQTGWSTSRRRAATCARPRRACPGPCATHWTS